MAKKKTPQVVRSTTKRQLSHSQKQHRQQRFIMGAAIAIIAAVVILVGSGFYFQWYLPEIKPRQQVVLEVNDRQFNMAYFIDALSFYAAGYPQYASLFVDSVLNTIEATELMRQEAQKLDITVSEKDVDEKIKTDKLADSAAMRDLARGQLLSQKMRDEYFDPQIPEADMQWHVMAMFLESQSQVDLIKTRIAAGEDFAALAEELSLESTTQSGKGDLGFRPAGVLESMVNSSVLEAAVMSAQVGALEQVQDEEKSKSVGYWLIRVTERTEALTGARVSGILVGSEAEALAVKARVDAGEDFTTLAEEVSLVWDDENKDDRGNFTAESTEVFVEYALSATTPLNSVSLPIRDTARSSPGGFWLFKVVESGTRDISETDRDTLVNSAFTLWLEEKQADQQNTIVKNMTDEMKAFAAARVEA